MIKSSSFALILVTVWLRAAALESPAPAVPDVTIPGTETRTLHSDIVGQEYRLQVALPRGYRESTQRYPVVFVLDAQWDFPLLYAIYGEQYYDGFVPGLILVGILWGGKDPDPDVLRRRDFTPTDEGGNGDSGGAAKFLSFFEKELIPFVGQHYRVTDGRTLVGSSLGGLFTLYALFSRPDLFDSYIPTSPATPWDDGVIYNSAAGFAERSAQSPSRLFVAVGELESLHTPVMQLVAKLQEANYPGLAWASHVVTGAGHSGVKAEGNSRGLQFAFERPDLLLTEQELEPLLGHYVGLEDGTEVRVEARDGRLWGFLPESGQGWEFRALNRLNFYHPGEWLNVSFNQNEDGQIDGFVVETYDRTMHFRKSGPLPGAAAGTE